MAGADETVYVRLLCQILLHKAFCAAIQIILGEIPKAPLMKFRHEIKFRPKRLKGLQLEFLLIDCGRGGGNGSGQARHWETWLAPRTNPASFTYERKKNSFPPPLNIPPNPPSYLSLFSKSTRYLCSAEPSIFSELWLPAFNLPEPTWASAVILKIKNRNVFSLV